MQTIEPHLQALQQQNADLASQVAREQRRRLDREVEGLVPDYREVDRMPEWHKWLLGIDLRSGRVRQQLLNEAIAVGDARQVQAIFDDFKQGGQSTGTSTRTSSRRSATSGKQVYTNDSIRKLYEAHRRGAYNGREDDWNRIEADIFAAQREGRVQVTPFFSK
jgi:hypothetical protein